VHVLAPEEPDLGEAHERERRELGDLPVRRAHRVDNEQLLLGPEPADARLILGKERAAWKAIGGSRLLEHRADRAEVAVDRGRLRGAAALLSRPGLGLAESLAAPEHRGSECVDVPIVDVTHRLVEQSRAHRLDSERRGGRAAHRPGALPPRFQIGDVGLKEPLHCGRVKAGLGGVRGATAELLGQRALGVSRLALGRTDARGGQPLVGDADMSDLPAVDLLAVDGHQAAPLHVFPRW
jgi:hypothetical protein